MTNIIENKLEVTGKMESLNRMAKFVKTEKYEFDLWKGSEIYANHGFVKEPYVEITQNKYYVIFQTKYTIPRVELTFLSANFPDLIFDLKYEFLDDHKKGNAIIEYSVWKKDFLEK